MTATKPDAWQELCKVSIIRSDGTVLDYHAITEEISYDFADKDFEGLVNIGGGRLKKITPEGDSSITLKVYDLSVEDSDNSGIYQLFNPPTTEGETQPHTIDNTHNREEVKAVLLWATKLPADATVTPDIGEYAWREQYLNCEMTAYNPDYSDKIKSAECVFKFTPFDKEGNPNRRLESTDTTAQLADVDTTAIDTF